MSEIKKVRELEPKVYVVDDPNAAEDNMRLLERIARVPYKSEGNMTDRSYQDFLRKIVGRGHTAMIEFERLTFIIQCDRGVTHELVRHRIASFAQESTRYCNYDKDKPGAPAGLAVIRPFFYRDGTNEYQLWRNSIIQSAAWYANLIEAGSTPQEARSVLPNSTKAAIAIQMNFRELLQFFFLRCAETAHPQMRQVAIPLARYCKLTYPEIFENIPWHSLPITSESPNKLLEGDLASVVVLRSLADWPEDL